MWERNPAPLARFFRGPMSGTGPIQERALENLCVNVAEIASRDRASAATGEAPLLFILNLLVPCHQNREEMLVV